MKKHLFVGILLVFVSVLCAQKKDKLQMGDNIPASRITVVGEDQKPTQIDLPNKKSTTDRFVLVYFFSATNTVKELVSFNNQVERILNKFQNNACKGASSIEYVSICAEKDYKKWQQLFSETNFNKSKFTGKKTNYLARGGLKDDALRAFKVTELPSLFLVNPKGKLFTETDSFEVLEKTFQNICRVNASSATADIYGKLLVGEKNKTPLTQHNVYLLKENNDTLNKTSTDNFGDFVFRQVDTTQNLSIFFHDNEKTKGGTKIYLSIQNGELVTEIRKNIRGKFEYKLLKIDVQKLSEIEEDEDITMKYKKFNTTNKKDLTVAENIYYEQGKYAILTENEIVLDKVIVILNADPSVNLQIISHTDAIGDDNSNLKLSENRSLAVINYLLSKGIDKKRLMGIGKGETQIRNRCINGVTCSDKEQEYNRRTEFKFIKN